MNFKKLTLLALLAFGLTPNAQSGVGCNECEGDSSPEAWSVIKVDEYQDPYAPCDQSFAGELAGELEEELEHPTCDQPFERKLKTRKVKQAEMPQEAEEGDVVLVVYEDEDEE